MPINLPGGYHVAGATPIDDRFVVANKFAIPSYLRYEGLTVYETATQQSWTLVGGIADGNWETVGAALPMGGTNADVLARDPTGEATWASPFYTWMGQRIFADVSTTPGTLYVGRAASDALGSDPVWTIQKWTFDPTTGDIATLMLSSAAAIWDNRTTEQYN